MGRSVEALRQGDVALFSVAKLPKKARITSGNLVIRGEGLHKHTLPGVQVALLDRPRLVTYVVVGEQGRKMNHDGGHPLLPVGPGIYRVCQARGYRNDFSD